MAKRKIVTLGDEILEKKAHAVTRFDDRLHTLLDDMRDTLTEANGAGLAAPQVGVLRRIFIVSDGETITEYINPEIVEIRGEQYPQEGCLSYPGHYGVTRRPQYLKIRAYDRYGNPFEREGEDFFAQVCSHENDHLEGRMFLEKVVEWLDMENDSGEES